MKKVKVYLGLVMSVLILASCSIQQKEKIEMSNNIEHITTAYLNYSMLEQNLYNSERNIKIFDENEFKTETDRLIDRMENDPVLYQLIRMENEVNKEIFENSKKNLTPDAYQKKYYEIVQRKNLEEATKARRSVPSGKYTITDETPIDNEDNPITGYKCRLSFFKENYKKGNIIVNTGSGSSSSGDFGHSTIMSEDVWGRDWDNKPLAKTTVTAWPRRGFISTQVDWSYKEDFQGAGVQQEPIGYWICNESFCSPDFTIYRIVDNEGNEPTEAEQKDICSNWRDYDGYEYNLLARKYANTNYVTCAKIVWMLWYNINRIKYNIVSDEQTKSFIKPVHLASSKQVVPLCTYTRNNTSLFQ